MSDIVIAEVLRGGRVESQHAGAFVVTDADGKVVLSGGEVAQRVYPRSAIKGLQALPFVESGAPERFGLAPAALALACASHGGEEGHVETAAAALAAAGLSERDLECGCHWPMRAEATQALAAKGGKPSQLHNNCSGKHAGFLCLACAAGMPTKGYVNHDHPVQKAVKAAVEDMTGYKVPEGEYGIDGCSIPTYAIPLQAMAYGFARFGTGHRMGPERKRAAEALRAAVAQTPWHVAGTDRFCTKAMELVRERAFVKTGAEGVFCGALPEQGLGFAVKCSDGAGRAAEVATAAILLKFLRLADGERTALEALARPVQKNWNGIETGSLRPGAAFA